MCRWPAYSGSFVDAQWGLERMIGQMAEVRDTGPFPS
jgi:hypothetical protein